MRKIIMLAGVVLLANGLTTTAFAGLTKTYSSIDQGAAGWGGAFGPAWIDGNNTPMSIDITVGDSGAIDTFDLITAIDLSHTWVGDLTITLEHLDTGTLAVLVNRPGLGPFDDIPGGGCCGNNVDIFGDYSWADGNPTWSDVGSPLPPGTYGPEGFASSKTPLSSFAGEDKNGTWRLTIYDGAGGDIGAIKGFEITLTNVPAPGALALLGMAGLIGRRKRNRA